tara:strand:- start:96 stop:641 length:546 start_codon:yes stop_codon:yes gene_type:complete
MKKLLGIFFFTVSLISTGSAKELILYCPTSLSPIADDIYYIDNKKKTVGAVNIIKKKKIMEVYKWHYKNVKFEKHKITFNDDGNFLYHLPEQFPFYKTEISRKKPLTSKLYQKDRQDLPDIIQRSPSIIEDQARKLLNWKIYDTRKCKIIDDKLYENYSIKFVSEDRALKRNTSKEEKNLF